jgi:polyhydroxyalkanoate synthesis repressor PhaR
MPTTRRAQAGKAAKTTTATKANKANKASTRAKAAPTDTDAASPLRTLKKYPNRRLYDTRTSSYVTLADVKQMVLAGEAFEVRDAKTSEDLTRSILLQIILEEESGGVPMFSSQTLSQIIRLYGHAMQGVMGTVLEKNMAAFSELQSQFLNPSKGLYDPKHLSPELWTQFMTGQAPALQNLMGGYLEQSRAMFEKMQQAGAMFPGMVGFPATKK